MTVATSTAGADDGAEARTLPLLQPRASSSTIAPAKPAEIRFTMSLPLIAWLPRLSATLIG
jgi:hypothetical protein